MDDHAEISYPVDGHAACAQVEDRSFWFRHRNDCIAALVDRFTPKTRFADIGGGNGFISLRLQDEGHDVVLIEPGAEGARNASRRGIKNVICAALEDASGIPCGLGAVGAFDVVEHIRDDAAFVGKVASLLDDGGYFYSTVPAHGWLWSSADDEAGHFRRYTARSYAELLKPHFEVAFISYFFAPLVFPIAIFRSIPYRLGARNRSTPATAAREHATGGGLSSRIMSRLLQPEIDRIATLKTMSFGTSLIVAARKRG